ncbi:helix-turn-helix domain-containing protein, partial [Rhizobium johnstonii]|uniref:helix-turn-helix domain-containing protein n=1 Tax=Rhizobium johnstonii TaxID=3019933 RepID=UPI003F9856EA
FSSVPCAFLDQDPDALIAIAELMQQEDFGVMPLPKGPDGKSFPTIGYGGWSMFTTSGNKDSPNGKRYARRDRAGDIGEAFGFSVAPLLA